MPVAAPLYESTTLEALTSFAFVLESLARPLLFACDCGCCCCLAIFSSTLTRTALPSESWFSSSMVADLELLDDSADCLGLTGAGADKIALKLALAGADDPPFGVELDGTDDGAVEVGGAGMGKVDVVAATVGESIAAKGREGDRGVKVVCPPFVEGTASAGKSLTVGILCAGC